MDKKFKNILCIRADNMGDLLMSSPAIRALKETFSSKITVLTSSAASEIVRFIPEIDDVITYNLPWVKTSNKFSNTDFFNLISKLQACEFDAAIIFTVYSQNPLPAAMLTYMADIPVRVAYCRENPYELLTHWIPEQEPYAFIRHQVKRDLDLVSILGAGTLNDRIAIRLPKGAQYSLNEKLIRIGVDLNKPWLLLHPGVSEKKRECPPQLWIETSKQLSHQFQLLFTGSVAERDQINQITQHVGVQTFALGGLLDLDEFATLIKQAPLVISVNTGTIHIAAAVGTSVVVLYALTNPQHLPWKTKGKALYFDIPDSLKSKNEVIRFVNQTYFHQSVPMIKSAEIVNAVYELLSEDFNDTFPSVIDINKDYLQRA